MLAHQAPPACKEHRVCLDLPGQTAHRVMPEPPEVGASLEHLAVLEPMVPLELTGHLVSPACLSSHKLTQGLLRVCGLECYGSAKLDSFVVGVSIMTVTDVTCFCCKNTWSARPPR